MKEAFYNLFSLNESLFIKINHATNLGPLPEILHYISSVFFIANFAVAYVIACIYFYFKIRTADNREIYFDKTYQNLVRIGICYALFGFTFAALKFSVNLPRPFCSLPEADFITIADIASERCLSSFPSAHTGLAILVAYALWPALRAWHKVVAIVVISLVAISRITLAMHYPADILYSSLVTLAVILVGNFIHHKLNNLLIKPIGNFIFHLLF